MWGRVLTTKGTAQRTSAELTKSRLGDPPQADARGMLVKLVSLGLWLYSLDKQQKREGHRHETIGVIWLPHHG